MKPQDLTYLVIMIVSVGMMLVGMNVPSVGLMMWLGIILAVGFAVTWGVSIARRHGDQY